MDLEDDDLVDASIALNVHSKSDDTEGEIDRLELKLRINSKTMMIVKILKVRLRYQRICLFHILTREIIVRKLPCKR